MKTADHAVWKLEQLLDQIREQVRQIPEIKAQLDRLTELLEKRESSKETK